jgi:hypothetical protein
MGPLGARRVTPDDARAAGRGAWRPASPASTGADRRSLAAFASALFLGAWLLFLVEPIAGKALLPKLGGSPSTWTACVLSFQALLLAAYAYAHATARFGTRVQAAAQLILLTLAVAWLPRSEPGITGVPGPGMGLLWLLATLGESLALPFFVLATSGPVLQRWFSRGTHPAARDPYFLYATSNAGSLLGLLAYPLLVEPLLPVPTQWSLWRAGYLACFGVMVACVVLAWRWSLHEDGVPAPGKAMPATSWPQAGGWVALAAVPSSLLLGVTTYLSTDVAAVPLLWVLPLALYLASFVVAFGRHGPLATRVASRALPTLALLAAMLMIGGLAVPLALLVPLHLATFSTSAIACHGELARRRPPASRLTGYYLWLAVGGALGSAFNALLAPVLFTAVLEYPIALVAACALRPGPDRDRAPGTDAGGRLFAAAAPLAAGVLALAAVVWANHAAPPPRLLAAALAVPVLVASRLVARPRPHAAALALMLLAGRFYEGGYGAVVHAERTFFGVYRVQEDTRAGYRFLMNGTTLHGMASLDPRRRLAPLGYYHRAGPLGQAFACLPGAAGPRIAVVGLGVGSLAAYAREGQHWTFFEVDPAVERLARQPAWFGYLDACGARCSVTVGDARLSLAGPGPAWDLIVLDAFSSDSVPVHLITREAFELYRARLTPDGALLVHFSNRDLELEPVLGRVARELGLVARACHDAVPRFSGGGRLSSEWMALGAKADALGGLSGDSRWRDPEVRPGTPLWTDDYSNLLGVLRYARSR